MTAMQEPAGAPGSVCHRQGLKLVYSPLNGSGQWCRCTRVLSDIGITDVTIVPEQKDPDGNFPTCPYPNPEICEALRLGLELAEKDGADLMLATDPDADRVGIAVRCKDGELPAAHRQRGGRAAAGLYLRRPHRKGHHAQETR